MLRFFHEHHAEVVTNLLHFLAVSAHLHPSRFNLYNTLTHILKSPLLAHTGISLSVFNMKQFTHWSQILTVRRPCPTPAISLLRRVRREERERERRGKGERGGWREHVQCSRMAVWSLEMSSHSASCCLQQLYFRTRWNPSLVSSEDE